MKVTDIYEAMNSKAEAFFEWLQAHPKYGLLFGVGLLALWLAGLVLLHRLYVVCSRKMERARA